MKLIKPKFWDQSVGILAALFFPISLIYILIVFIKKKLVKKINFKIPIVCIGNIYIGGTGKTPAAILLAKKILNSGKKPAILRKYYKNHRDEYDLIKSKFKNLILNKNRNAGINEIIKSNFDVAILDDGLQDYSIKKDLSIVCFNSNQKSGNGLVLPSGPLREQLSSLKDTEIVIINGNIDKSFEEKLLKINKRLEIFNSFYKPVNIDQFKNKNLFAIAGIGCPENFFELLENNNLLIKKKLSLPDHHKFSKKEVLNILDEAEKKDYQIIMTEKDYYKIKDFTNKRIGFLKVSLEINDLNRLLNKINKLYDKIN